MRYKIICFLPIIILLGLSAPRGQIKTANSINIDAGQFKADDDSADFQANRAGEQIKWQVISSGGAVNAASGMYVLSGTAGQTAVGTGTSANYGLTQGFWQNFGTGNCCLEWGTPGDANGDHAVNLIDILYLIAYKYSIPPGPGNPDGCDELLDVNGDYAVNLVDILYLISYKYDSPAGPAPICPM